MGLYELCLPFKKLLTSKTKKSPLGTLVIVIKRIPPGTWVLFQPQRRKEAKWPCGCPRACFLVGDRIHPPPPPPQLIYAENCQPAAMTYFPLYSTASRAWQGYPASRKPGVQKPKLGEHMHWGCLLTICFTKNKIKYKCVCMRACVFPVE